MVRHTHDPLNENCVWHDGSLADCPESKFEECIFEGRPARFYYGLAVLFPPNMKNRFRFVDKVEAIS